MDMATFLLGCGLRRTMVEFRTFSLSENSLHAHPNGWNNCGAAPVLTNEVEATMYPSYARPNYSRPRYIALSLIAAPFVAFAVYVAWIVVPIVVSVVVSAVVQSVTTSN
jgi:hypothetical protein